jgi:transposase InsO family protein
MNVGEAEPGGRFGMADPASQVLAGRCSEFAASSSAMSLEDLNLRPHPERRIAPVSTGSLSLAGHAPILIHRGGHKVLGRPAGRKHRGGVGYAYLHTAIDDHSRLAYTESLADERQETAARFWQRAHAWFTSCGITVQRVMTDNGSCYRSVLWRHTLAAAGITHKRTRAYRPQTMRVDCRGRRLPSGWLTIPGAFGGGSRRPCPRLGPRR